MIIMFTVAESCLMGVAVACGVLRLAGLMERGFEYMTGLFALLDACLVVFYLLQHGYLAAAWFAFCGALCAWSWWNERRKRRRKRKAAAVLGAKSRALRDALVRRAREVTVPRPVLRHVPQPG